MQAVILAGGLGTRLLPVVSDRSKPMAVVDGKPFLEYLLLQLRRWAIVDVILCIGHRGESVRDYIDTGDRWGLRVRYSQELESRGTGGALKLAADWIETDQVLVMNGDSFFDVDLASLGGVHTGSDAIATLALARVEDTQRFGAVEIDETGTIRQFVEKGQTRGGGLINGGIYLFARSLLTMIPDGRAVSLEQEIFPKLIGRRFMARPFDAYFVDIGTPASYRDLQADPSRLLAAIA